MTTQIHRLMQRSIRLFESSQRGPRNGSIIVLSCVLMIVFISVAALSVDLGYINNVQTELDRAVDAAALASAGSLIDGVETAESKAVEYIRLNNVGGAGFNEDDVQFEVGQWDDVSRTFTPSDSTPSAVRVTAIKSDQRPMFFGRVLKKDAFPIRAEAVAMFQPRDIMVALDFSGSMNDDSEFQSFARLGQASVEANLTQIYGELGSPVYGTLAVTPQWMKVKGAVPNITDKPQLYVEYQITKAVVSSTKPFVRIRAYKSSTTYTESTSAGTWNAAKGMYETTMDYSTNRITRVYIESGYKNATHTAANVYSENFYWDTTANIRASAKSAFGLTSTAWPYPGGSWDAYIDYVASSSGQNATAGYRYKFGYLNWVNYLLEQNEASTETPVLWQTSEQPVTALKNAMSVFVSFLQEVDADDKMGLAIYNSTSNDCVLEHALSSNLNQVDTTTRHRQAGHYTSLTNIGSGIRVAVDELQANARVGSAKLIVLMTDGVANTPNNSTYARSYVITQANRAASFGYPIVTISLGAGADTALLQQVADTTGGVHFNVPGGHTVAELEAQLREVFHQVAANRPLKLVQ